MPGIVGIFSPLPARWCKATLRAMLAPLRHEHWYDSGSSFDEDAGVYIGWTRLADGAERLQPITNETGDVSLWLAGEVLTEPAAIEAIRSRGHRLREDGLDYPAHLYEERGEGFLAELNGLFAGALIDARQRRCYLFTDRYGIERLFFHQGRDGLFFASEAKALLAVLPETRRLDPSAVGEFLACGCTLGERSLFQGIAVFPAGSVLEARKAGAGSVRSYFAPREWESQPALTAEEFSREVVESMPAALRRITADRARKAISLTGGLDSRIVAACLDFDGQSYPCYTFGSMYRDTLDVSIARQVAARCGQEHTVLTLGEEFLERAPGYLEGAVFKSDGYIGLSGAAELYLNALARGIAPIRLTGNYGSELLRGVRAFKSQMPRPGFFAPELEPYLAQAAARFRELEVSDPTSFALFRQAPLQGFGRLSIEKSQVALRTPFMDNELAGLLYRRPAGYSGGTELSVRIIRRYRPELARINSDFGDLGRGGGLARGFRKAYLETLAKAEYWSGHGMPQWLSALSRSWPWSVAVSRLVGRSKFQHFRQWAGGELAEYIREVLLSARGSSSYLDGANLERELDHHLAGRRNYLNEIDRALSLVLCEKLLLRPRGI